LRVRPTANDPEFSYFSEQVEFNGRSTTVAEMFWSDLSQVQTGFLATLRNFFKLAADAPEIVYASLGPQLQDGGYKDYLVLRLMRSLVSLAFWTIYYPIIAYNVGYGLLALSFVFLRTVVQQVVLLKDYAPMLATGDALSSPADWPMLITSII